MPATAFALHWSSALLIVLVGSLGATMLSFPFIATASIPKYFKKALLPGAQPSATDTIALIVKLTNRARTEGLPVSCDVTPHHIALTDRWLAGDRHWSWEVDDGDPLAVDDGSAYATSLRVCPPLRSASDAAACRAALRDGTAVAIATDHAPHSREQIGRAHV